MTGFARSHRRLGAAIAAAALLFLGALVGATRAAADTMLAPARAQDLAVSGDTLVWSEKQRRGRYRLMALRGGRRTRLQIRPNNSFPFFPASGTDVGGANVVVYQRCKRGKCRTLEGYWLSERREQRLPVRAGRGCELQGPSMDRGAIAYIRRGRCRNRGIWLQLPDGRTRRLTRRDDACCTALIGDTAAWIGSPESGTISVIVAPPSGPAFEVFRNDNTYPLDVITGNIGASGGLLYWSVSTWKARARRPTDARVYRAQPQPKADCEASNRQFPAAGGLPIYAVDESGLRYADKRSVRLADSPPPVFGPAFSPFPQFTAQDRVGRGCWAF